MNQLKKISIWHPQAKHTAGFGSLTLGYRNQRGQNLVEFALVLPILMLILILLITIPGFGAWDQLVASNIADQAAQDGANATFNATYANEQTVACQIAIPEATQQ